MTSHQTKTLILVSRKSLIKVYDFVPKIYIVVQKLLKAHQ